MGASRIRQLDDGVINQIAAGEVVERPASVLKELLENAVDAGSGRIEAAVTGAFPFTVRVTDDGGGMTADEVRLAILRHTTSKIASAEDLHRIATYGFRGEALPSIASVSHLRIVTRPRDLPSATELVAEGGRVVSVRETGAPPGTTVEVSELFANVPARRKFLKSARTEAGRLWEAFHEVAVPREGIHFRMSAGGDDFAYDAAESAIDRLFRRAGEDGKYLVRVARSSFFYRIQGWVGLPQLSRASGTGLSLFVNGRHFRDRALAAAVREAYRGILAADRHPVTALLIACDPAEVDVNVHPAKAEVRFRYSRELFELVRFAIGEALGELPLERRSGYATGGEGRRASDAAPILFARGDRRAPSLFGEPPAGGPPKAGDAAPPHVARFSALRPVAQLFQTYIVCEGPGEVLLIDQHAGHERIVFSRLKDVYLGAKGAIQHWLVEQRVGLPGPLRDNRRTVEDFLARAGFAFERDGDNAYRITGGLAILGNFDAAAWWKDLCDFLVQQESAPKGIFDADRELWRMACFGSVRAGVTLDADGMKQFLRDLDRAVASHSCPHGRPVWVRFSRAEMGRMFGRS